MSRPGFGMLLPMTLNWECVEALKFSPSTAKQSEGTHDRISRALPEWMGCMLGYVVDDHRVIAA